MYQRLRDTLVSLLRETLQDFDGLREWVNSQGTLIYICALVIGIVVGYAAWGFRLALAEVQHLFYGERDERLVGVLLELPWWQLLAAPTIGGLLVALFVKYLMPGGRPQGVPDVIEAGIYTEGHMSLRAGLGAAFINILSLGAGASTGREGPLVHLGGSLSGFISKKLDLDRSAGHTMLACGVASGVAASFNAPIAGVIFAHEVVLGHFALRALAPVVLSAVMGTIVTRVHIGDFPAFLIPQYDILSFWQFPAFMLLGILCGLIALVFFWSVSFSTSVFQRVPVSKFWRVPLAGFLVGCIGLLFPEVIGVGYEATDNALKQEYTFVLLVALVAAKMAATSISVAGGFGGGVFSPSLFLGAMTGGAFGIVAASIFPELAAEHGLYAIVGMGAVASAVLGAPLSTLLIVFELTGDYRVTILLMVSVVLSNAIAKHFRYRNIFHWQLENREVRVVDIDQVLLHGERVGDVMDRDFECIADTMPISEMRVYYRDHDAKAFYVVDANDRLIGEVGLVDAKHALLDPEMNDDCCCARDLLSDPGGMLTPEMPLDEARDQFKTALRKHLPVVSDPHDPHLIGVLHYRDLVEAHNRALESAKEEMR